MITKMCFKCSLEKSLYDFYLHPQMKDGHFNKCKDCIAIYSKLKYEENRLKPAWLVKERKRCRLKQSRFRRDATPEQLARLRVYSDKAVVRWNLKNKEKRKAQSIAARGVRAGNIIKPMFCGQCGLVGKLEKHHSDYTKPLDVMWLCILCHAKTRRLGGALAKNRIV